MAASESDGPVEKALLLLSEALSLLDISSQHLAAAFVAQAVNVLETKHIAPY